MHSCHGFAGRPFCLPPRARLARDAEFPLFHYDLASLLALDNKKSESLQELRLAYQFQKKRPGEQALPDPMGIESFRKFAGDESFVSAVRQIQQE